MYFKARSGTNQQIRPDCLTHKRLQYENLDPRDFCQ